MLAVWRAKSGESTNSGGGKGRFAHNMHFSTGVAEELQLASRKFSGYVKHSLPL